MEGGRARAATTADGGPPPCLGRTATFSRRGRARGESVEDRMAHAGHAMLDAMKAAGSRLQGKRHSATPRDAQPVHIAEDTMEKLFGASEESLQRKVETAEHGRLVIHPHSRFRAAWEAVDARSPFGATRAGYSPRIDDVDDDDGDAMCVSTDEHGESDALIGAFHGAIGPCGTTPCCRSWKTG